ncbi:MAG: serine hydrolase [Eubacteriales bacterium]|nr:serine hydrolase [Eubacteriales bacterium]
MAARKRYRRRKRRRDPALIAALVFVELVILMTLFLIIGWNQGISEWLKNLNRPVVKELDISGINSSRAILINAGNGKVLGETGADEITYPASLTKMMTAIVAIEKIGSRNLDTEITMTNEMYAGLYEHDLTQAGFQSGEVVKAIDLLYGVMLPSGAECCQALACHVSGSEEAFVELMNKKAKKIGMENTHFCNTTGVHADDHYSTPRDMAILLKYCLRNKQFKQIISSSYHATAGTNVHPDGITVYSSMFKNISDPTVPNGQIKGGKTGFTNAAGFCLASYAEIGGRNYILVTMGAQASPQHVQDAVTIYNRLGQKSLEL